MKISVVWLFSAEMCAVVNHVDPSVRTGWTRTLFLPKSSVALEFWCRDST